MHFDDGAAASAACGQHGAPKNLLVRFQAGFERGFETFPRELPQRPGLDAVRVASLTVAAFAILMVVSLLSLSRCWDAISFRRSMPARCACTCARRPGTRLEKTQQYFADVEAEIRQPRRQRSNRRDARQHRPALQRHQYRLERFGHRGPDGRRDTDFPEQKASARRRSSSPMLRRRTAGAFRAAAVLLSTGRHRRSGAEFRPAGAHRCPGLRAGSGRGIQPWRRRSRAL